MTDGLYDEDGRLRRELRPFEVHGVNFVRLQGTDQALGECPFCGKEKFFVKLGDTLWDCKGKECVGHRSGNLFTFLKQIAEFHCASTVEVDFKKLSKLRGIEIKELKAAGLGWNGVQWLIPVKNHKGTVVDIRTWREKGKLMSTSGCNMGLYGHDLLAKAGPGYKVWLCEGEWDALALRSALRKEGREKEIVVAVPGAGTFKKDWIPFFRKLNVKLAYDADEAGDSGMSKVRKALTGKAAKLEFIHWPEGLPSGFDTRDFFNKPGAKLSEFESLFHSKPRRADVSEIPAVEGDGGGLDVDASADKPGKVRTWDQLLKVFRSKFQMTPELESALKIVCAVTMTTWVEGDPVWVFLVSPPGGLKSEILMSLQNSPHAVCKSSISPKALCSGWRGEGGEDPSLLPKLHGRNFILKDYTEITAMHSAAQEEILGVLRGAFDGEVDREFGNGVNRKYKTHFHICAGVTPTIHGNSKAALGERFLKFTMQRGVGFNAENAIRAALRNVGVEDSVRDEVKEATRSFIATLYERFRAQAEKGPFRLPDLTDGAVDRLVHLSQMISMLRADVERSQRDTSQILYRPQHEVGTRIAKQLKKLGGGLAFVSGTDVIGPEDERLVHQVAMDTARGFHLDIFEAVVRSPGEDTAGLAKNVSLPSSTLRERLADLELLGVVHHRVQEVTEAEKYAGRKPYGWYPTRRALQLWKGLRMPESTRPTPTLRIKVKKKGS